MRFIRLKNGRVLFGSDEEKVQILSPTGAICTRNFCEVNMETMAVVGAGNGEVTISQPSLIATGKDARIAHAEANGHSTPPPAADASCNVTPADFPAVK